MSSFVKAISIASLLMAAAAEITVSPYVEAVQDSIESDIVDDHWKKGWYGMGGDGGYSITYGPGATIIGGGGGIPTLTQTVTLNTPTATLTNYLTVTADPSTVIIPPEVFFTTVRNTGFSVVTVIGTDTSTFELQNNRITTVTNSLVSTHTLSSTHTTSSTHTPRTVTTVV